MGVMDFIDLTNYRKHPTHPGYQVFHFRTRAQADYFEMLLQNDGIEYERFDDTEGRMRTYFAIRQRDIKQVLQLNNMCIGKFRKPMLGNRVFGMIILVIMTILVAVAVYGYLKSGQ